MVILPQGLREELPYSLICAENMPILTLTDRVSISIPIPDGQGKYRIPSLMGRVSISIPIPGREGCIPAKNVPSPILDGRRFFSERHFSDKGIDMR